MDLKGKDVLSASKEQVWNSLMDSNLLAKITPGVSTLEEIEPDKYKAIADINIGPVNGSFKGKLDILDKVDQESFTIKVNQKSKIGNVDAKVNILLTELDANKTELSFAGRANMSGLLARTGSRVMTGVANTITKQFFEAFREELSVANVKEEPEPELNSNSEISKAEQQSQIEKSEEVAVKEVAPDIPNIEKGTIKDKTDQTQNTNYVTRYFIYIKRFFNKYFG